MGHARLPDVPDSSESFRLVGVRIIDGTGAEALADGEVAIERGRISYAGPRRDGPAQTGRTVELPGKTVLPGFIDVHTHMALNLEEKPARTLSKFPAEAVLDAAGNLRKTLMAGITTARDLAGLTAGYRSAIARGVICGPRMHLAILALSPTGGHVDAHLPNGRTAPGLDALDGGASPLVDSDDDLRRTVRTLVRSGADVIKVCTTGGVSSPSDSPHDLGISEHQVRLITEEMARRQDQPVAAHAQGTAGILEAIRGGVTSVEHGYEIDQEGIDLMLERDIFLVPTLSSALRVPDPGDVPDYLYQKKVIWSRIAREHITRAIQAGVKIAMGTDAAVCPHGENLKELGYLVELGMRPMDAIVAGTRNAATLLRLEDQLGTIEAGKRADLVVTEVDPLAEIAALGSPENVPVVIQGGNLVKDLHRWLPLSVVTTTLG